MKGRLIILIAAPLLQRRNKAARCQPPTVLDNRPDGQQDNRPGQTRQPSWTKTTVLDKPDTHARAHGRFCRFCRFCRCARTHARTHARARTRTRARARARTREPRHQRGPGGRGPQRSANAGSVARKPISGAGGRRLAPRCARFAHVRKFCAPCSRFAHLAGLGKCCYIDYVGFPLTATEGIRHEEAY